MKYRIPLSRILVLAVALAVVAIPETTYAAEPSIRQFQYQGEAAYATWTTCPDWDALAPGKVCTDTIFTVGEDKTTGKSLGRWQTKGAWLHLGQNRYTFDRDGNYINLSRTSAFTRSPSYNFDRLIAGASVDMVLPVNHCTYGMNPGCTESELEVEGTWTGIGERRHVTDTYRWQAGNSRVIAHYTGWVRDAAVELKLGGNPVTGVTRYAILSDVKSGSLYLSHNQPNQR